MTPCLEHQPISLMRWCGRLVLLWLGSADYALPFCAPLEPPSGTPLVPSSISLSPCPLVFFPTPYSSSSLSAPSCFLKITLQYEGERSVKATQLLLLSVAKSYPTLSNIFSSVQSLSCTQLFATPMDGSTPRTVACQAPLSFTISQHLLKFKSIESVMPSNHLILCCSLLLLPLTFPSIRVFSSELALPIRWPKY